MQNESFNSSHFTVISENYFELNLLEGSDSKDMLNIYKISKNYSKVSNTLLSKDKNDDIIKINSSNINISNLNHIDNFRACLYMIIAIILFSLMNLGGKAMFEYFPEIENITSCFFRGLITLIFAISYANKNDIEIKKQLEKDSKKTFLLILRNFIWAFCNYSIFEALKYMRISSAITVYNTSPIFTSILSVIFLKSKFTSFDFFSLIICFISVCLITKPAFLNFFFDPNISGEDTYLGNFNCFDFCIFYLDRNFIE